jgi:hypothetical protein
MGRPGDFVTEISTSVARGLDVDSPIVDNQTTLKFLFVTELFSYFPMKAVILDCL